MSAPCIHCGEPCNEVVVENALGEVACGWMCDPCLAVAEVEFAELRRQFDELVAAGVSPEQANAIMIARMEGAEVS